MVCFTTLFHFPGSITSTSNSQNPMWETHFFLWLSWYFSFTSPWYWGFKLQNVTSEGLYWHHHQNILVFSKDMRSVEDRQASREHSSRKDGKVLPWILWLLCLTPELHNYSPESAQFQFSFLFHGHVKLQIPPSHTERAAPRGTAEQESTGAVLGHRKHKFSCVFCVTKHYHGNMAWAGKSKGQTSPLWTALPISQLPMGLFHILNPKFPLWEATPELWQSPEPGSIHKNCLFSWLHKAELWKKIIWNHLKMAPHCHFLPEASCHKSGHNSESQELWLSPRKKLDWNRRIWLGFLQNLKRHVGFFFFPNRR